MRDFWDKVRATYWFVPSLMTLLAALSALVLLWVNQVIPNYLLQDKWYIFHPESITEARNVLTNIADTSLAVIGVVFSITLVPLSIASTQYGSIVLRTFLRDRGTQFVLGAYTATTFFCLFFLMGLRSTSNQTSLRLPVTVAVYMLLVSLLLLLYFFHHVADSLQASTVIEQVSKELEEVIEESYSTGEPTAPSAPQQGDEAIRQEVLRDGEVITSTREGYVRAIDYKELMKMSTKRKLVLCLKCLPGDFVGHSDQLLLAWPSPLDKHVTLTANRAYILGKNRTLFQDPEFGIYLIVIIAVRALSPAINDAITPVLCLDRLGAALSMLAVRPTLSPYYYDKGNQLRIMTTQVSFQRLVDMAFNLIREYGRANAEVLMKMLETIKTVTAHTHSPTQREVLLKHATLIEHDSHIGLPSEYDQQRVHE
jgi:uncharacterized membrane protein